MLVVEDHDDTREALGACLTMSGALVLTAPTAIEALPQIVMCDVVVTDLAMSGRDGRWLVQQVRASARPVPVIAVTGYEDDYDLSTAPFARVLTKPVDPDTLIGEILHVLGRGLRPADGSRVAAGARAGQPGDRATTGRVLVVEDDVDVLETLSDMLAGLGYDPVRCRNGLQALEAMRAAAPDAIVLDILLPGLLGWELMPRLRAERPEVQVIMISAATSPDVERAALAQGAFGYVAKPIDRDRLGTLLAAAVVAARRARGM